MWLQPGRQNKQKRVDHDSFGPLQAKSRRLKFPVYYFPSENSSFWDVSFHLACWYYGGHLWGKFDLILVIIHISLAFKILAIFSLLFTVQKYTIQKKKMPEDKTLSTIIPIQNGFLVYCKILYKFRLEACFFAKKLLPNLYVIILPSFFIVFLLFSHI